MAQKLLCVLLVLGLRAAAPAGETKPVWLLGNGFHSSLAIRLRDVPALRKLSADPRADLLVIGWGDAEFYRGNVTPWTTLAAIFWPTPSVLHVVPVRGSLRANFPHSDLVEFAIDAPQFRRFAAQLDAAFTRRAGEPILMSRGYFANSRFYAARERFYFPKMCNLWSAQQLRTGGVPLFLPATISADGLVQQATQSGVREQRRSRPADSF